MKTSLIQLLHKYDVPTPRYTSYPTVPYWDFDSINEEKWKSSVKQRFIAENGELALYIHLPFCENLCTFCACNKRITKNHKVEDPYITSVLKEWSMYREMLPFKPTIKEIHLGGGTPTFFSPENLERLIKGITQDCLISDVHEFSVEVHPNYTTEKHLQTLAECGFNRISAGVQDFDPKVQFAINRIQSFETTREVVDWARKHGYKSVNIDLVYGLPHQSIDSIKHSIACIKSLMPDRIAFYSYAHVPWKSKVQRRYSEVDLPDANMKWEMYHTGRTLLEESGFKSIGMDHFALHNDKMFEASAAGTLHRNFMGYTTTTSKLLLGLGVSSISDSWDAFIQNEKVVEVYEELIAGGKFPIINGHKLSSEDLEIRKDILDLMCQNKATLNSKLLDNDFINDSKKRLTELENDGLLSLNENTIVVTETGNSFIRNIASAIDARLWKNQQQGNVFSKAI